MAVINMLRLAWSWMVNIFLEIVWVSPMASVVWCFPSWSYILVNLGLEWLFGSLLCLVSCLRLVLLLSERIQQTKPTEEFVCDASPVIIPQRPPFWTIRVLCLILSISLISLAASLIRSCTWFLPVSEVSVVASFTPRFMLWSTTSGLSVFSLLMCLRVLTNFKEVLKRRFGFQVRRLSTLPRIWTLRNYLRVAVNFGMLATGILLITNTWLELSIPRDVVMWWILHGFVSLYSLYADFVFTHRTVLRELCKGVIDIRHSKQNTYTVLKNYVNLYLKCSLLNTSFVLFLLTYFWEELHCGLAMCTACLMLVCSVQTGLGGACKENRIQNLKNYLIKAVALTVEDGTDEIVTVTFNPLANEEEELLTVNGEASLDVAVLSDNEDEDREEHNCLERSLLFDRYIRTIFPELKLLDVEKKPYTLFETSENSDSCKTIP